jgi:hypothetical protein
MLCAFPSLHHSYTRNKSVKNPVPWTLTSERVFCAPAVMDSNAKKPTTLTPARLIDITSSINGLLFIFILRRPLLVLLSGYQCEPQRSLQPRLKLPLR